MKIQFLILSLLFSMSLFAMQHTDSALSDSPSIDPAEVQLNITDLPELISFDITTPQLIRVYDQNLDLVYEKEVDNLQQIKDRKLKKLLRKASLIMSTEDTSLFRLNG